MFDCAQRVAKSSFCAVTFLTPRSFFSRQSGLSTLVLLVLPPLRVRRPNRPAGSTCVFGAVSLALVFRFFCVRRPRLSPVHSQIDSPPWTDGLGYGNDPGAPPPPSREILPSLRGSARFCLRFPAPPRSSDCRAAAWVWRPGASEALLPSPPFRGLSPPCALLVAASPGRSTTRRPLRRRGVGPATGRGWRPSGRRPAVETTHAPVSYTHLTLPTICSV